MEQIYFSSLLQYSIYRIKQTSLPNQVTSLCLWRHTQFLPQPKYILDIQPQRYRTANLRRKNPTSQNTELLLSIYLLCVCTKISHTKKNRLPYHTTTAEVTYWIKAKKKNGRITPRANIPPSAHILLQRKS